MYFCLEKALVIGYGDVGKGSADSLNQQKMIVDITEIDQFVLCRHVLMDLVLCLLIKMEM